MSQSGWLGCRQVCGVGLGCGGVGSRLPRGLSDARVVGRWLCIAIFEGAKGFYMGGLCVRM